MRPPKPKPETPIVPVVINVCEIAVMTEAMAESLAHMSADVETFTSALGSPDGEGRLKTTESLFVARLACDMAELCGQLRLATAKATRVAILIRHRQRKATIHPQNGGES